MLVLLLRLVLSTLHFFAKIEDMNLEDLGSQFTNIFISLKTKFNHFT